MSENPYQAPITASSLLRETPLRAGEPSADLGPPSRVRFGVLGFSISMSILLYLDRFAIGVATPAMMEELGIDKTQMGFAIGAFFWSYALCQVPAGWLSDRWGARRTLTMYVAGWSLAIGLIGLAQTLTALIASRLLLGIAQAGAYATVAGFLKRWIPFNRRGLANSSITMAGRSGGMLSNLVTPLLMTYVVGGLFGVATGQWRYVFFFYCLLGLVWSVFFWRWFRNTPAEHPRCNRAEQLLIDPYSQAAAPAAHASVGIPIWEILTSANMLFLSLINFFVNVGWIFLTTWMPTYLKEVHGASLTLAGFCTALTGLAGMTGSVCGGLLTDRLVRGVGLVWGRRIPGLLAAGGAALVYVGCNFTDNIYAFVAIFASVYFLVDLGLGSIWSTYQDIGGRHVATVLGFGNMCGNLAAAIFASVIGFYAEADDWTSIFMMSSGSFVITFICWLFVDPRVQLVPEPRE